jgi:hypothetical protein
MQGKLRKNGSRRHNELCIAVFGSLYEVHRNACFILMDTEGGESISLRDNGLWISLVSNRRKVHLKVRYKFIGTKEGNGQSPGCGHELLYSDPRRMLA